MTHTVLNWAAMALYALTVGASAAATYAAKSMHQQPSHKRAWLLIGAMFLALVAWRGLGIEELLRTELRTWISSQVGYENRRTIQRPIAAVVFGIAALLALWWFYWTVRTVKGRRNVAIMIALATTCGMLALVGLRLISLHAIDALLYGALKLNWLADMGGSLLVTLSAFYYVKVVRRG